MTRVRLVYLLLIVAVISSSSSDPVAQEGRRKALVGGTLMDGFGGAPVRNSVILIDGERIKAVAQ